MRIFTFALAAVFALSGSALAQKRTHTVRSGQTLSAIASKYGVSQSAILRANSLSNAHRLKLGQKLSIPSSSNLSNTKSGQSVAKNSVRNAGGYAVRNGDHDWAISKKFGITVSQLHQMNPGVNWKALQIGQPIRVPGALRSTVASSKGSTAKVTAGGSYSVKSGDNDWIIARRVGSTPSKLRQVNPGVKWSALQIGQKLRVPGSTTNLVASSGPKITTRHAKIAKDDVTIRRGPSTGSGKVTTVPAGTYVTVLDKESGWYKLKFPKGTVGWVRGDMLKPLAAQNVARASTRTRRSNYVTVKTPAPKPTFSSAPVSSLALLDRAYGMLGVRYRWGASSRSATDCSGFTTQVFRSQGIKLPRTSREQAKVGSAVSKANLKPGDLVFFATRSSRRVSHVGIYTGNGKFIHSSSGKGHVRTDALTDGYYAKRFVGARRVGKKLAPGKSSTIVAKLEKAKDEKAMQDAIAATQSESAPVVIEPKEPGVVSKGQADR